MYDCRWGLDTVRVLVAGELPAEAHNASLHLFSARPELADFGRRVYRRRWPETSLLLGQLVERLRSEDLVMAYTMEDIKRDYIKEHFAKLSPEEREEVLRALPAEERLAGLPPEQRLEGLSTEQIRTYLERLTTRPAQPRKERSKK